MRIFVGILREGVSNVSGVVDEGNFQRFRRLLQIIAAQKLTPPLFHPNIGVFSLEQIALC